MKSLLATLSLAVLSFSAMGDTAIYRTTLRQAVFGNGAVQRLTARGFFLFDSATGAVTFIYGFKIGALKFLSVRRFNGHGVDRVDGPRGTSYTVISFAASPSTEYAGILLESLHLRGLNTNVTLRDAASLSIPRSFTVNARNVVRNTETGIMSTGETSGSSTLDVNGSRASNIVESYDAAVSRFTSYFTGLGYTLITLPPAN